MAKDDLIEDWLNNEASSPEEKAALQEMLDTSKQMEVPEKRTKEQAWDQLVSKINEESTSNEKILATTTSRRTWIGYAVGIAATLFLAYYFFFPSPATTFQAPPGSQQTYTLPDQSTVALNAGSTIHFKKKSWPENRSLKLSGEAFFEVTPGNDFTILTENGEIKVLGTSFNVFSRSNRFSVSCFSGQVAVTTKSQTEKLSRGMNATIDDTSNRLVVEAFDPQKTATWRIGDFYFDSAPLEEVIKVLERQFDMTIQVKTNIENRLYSGYFNIKNKTEALQLVFTPMDLSFEVNDKTVTVQ